MPAHSGLGSVQPGRQLGIDLRGCHRPHQFFRGARAVMRESTDSKGAVVRQIVVVLKANVLATAKLGAPTRAHRHILIGHFYSLNLIQWLMLESPRAPLFFVLTYSTKGQIWPSQNHSDASR